MDLAITEKSFVVVVAIATFVRSGRCDGAHLAAADRGAPQGAAYAPHEDPQRARQAVAQASLGFHALDRRPFEPAARGAAANRRHAAAPGRLMSRDAAIVYFFVGSPCRWRSASC
jgi:hypothetical protein